MIAFIGSVFSPYYAWSGRTDPENHAALNVALYGRPNRWTMTERPRRAVYRDRTHFQLGQSLLAWNGGDLTVDIRERGAPIPFPVEGRVRLFTEFITHGPIERDYTLVSAPDDPTWPSVCAGSPAAPSRPVWPMPQRAPCFTSAGPRAISPINRPPGPRSSWPPAPASPRSWPWRAPG